jgi:molybdopterin molybdotransferase
MAEFLTLVPVQQALDLFLRSIPETHVPLETLESTSAIGRVLAEEVVSPEDIPAFPRSTVDGYAVLAESTFGASETIPAYLKVVAEVKMGTRPNFTIHTGECALVYTGGMLPEGCNAVVMVENTQVSRPGEVEIQKAVSQGENCISIAEDVAKGDVILSSGTVLRPQEIGGLLTVGKIRIKVYASPKIGILSSGDEVVSPRDKLPLGKIRDINSAILGSMVELFGGQPVEYGISPDDEQALTQKVIQAYSECDAVIITAGSSVSTRDLTSRVIEKMGKPGVLVHGVNIKPGKPTILAVCNGKPLIGLPGNPVSAFVISRLFVKPMVEKLMGVQKIHVEPLVSATIQSNFPSQAGRMDYVPVVVSRDEMGFKAEPIHFKSNLIFSLVHADGLAIISEDSNGLVAGEKVNVLLI